MVSARTRDSLSEFAVKAASEKPDIVAATLYLFTYDFSMRAMRRIKKLLLHKSSISKLIYQLIIYIDRIHHLIYNARYGGSKTKGERGDH